MPGDFALDFNFKPLVSEEHGDEGLYLSITFIPL